jgi:TolB protein
MSPAHQSNFLVVFFRNHTRKCLQYVNMHLQNAFSRRQFLIAASLTPALANFSCSFRPGAARHGHLAVSRFFFVSQGKTALLNVDGTGLRYLEFVRPNQATWQPTHFFSDGSRVLFLSMEPRRDGPGKPFSEYYTQTPTHIWIYNIDSGALEEIATRERMAVFYTPALLINDHRMLVQVVRNKIGQIFSMNLDGTDAREFTKAEDGFPYGLSLSPNGQRVAYHISGNNGYEVWTADVTGANRSRVAGRAGHLYFGPMWSPDGQWLAYADCQPGSDPGHDWCAIQVNRPDGSEQKQLIETNSMWFAATYGNQHNHGGGSNLVSWTRDGSLLFPHRLPDSKVPWEFQPNRPDTDHFNRDFKPELARGGTEICKVNISTGTLNRLTHSNPAVWDFRCSESPDGRHIVFCRAETGGVPSIWIMDANGQNQREVTKGFEDHGADHPRWLPSKVS